MKKSIIQISLLFIISICGIMLFSTKISADITDKLGNTGTLPSLLNQEYNYCVQHGKAFNYQITYTYKYHIYIEGQQGTCYYDNGYAPKTKTFQANAELAYILGGGSFAKGYGSSYAESLEGKTERQIALWNFWNDWLKTANLYGGYNLIKAGGDSLENGNPTAPNSLISEAEQYAKNNSSSASVVSNTGYTINTYNKKLGPFNISYSGNIQNIEITDESGNAVTISDGISFEQNGKAINGTNIQSDTDFYIVNNSINNSRRVIKKVKISVGKEQDIYTADINILTATSGSQTIINVGTGKKSIQSSKSIEINIQTETLKVVKSTTDGTRQDDVGFIIYRAANSKNGIDKTDTIDGMDYGYLNYNKQSNMDVTGRLVFDNNSGFWLGESKEEQNGAREGATIFHTSTQEVNKDKWPGFFEISGLPPGTYYIGEVYNKNSGYESSILTSYTVEDNVNGSKGKFYDIAREKDNITRSNYNEKMPKIQVVQVYISGGKSTRVELIDGTKSQKETLRIEKTNTSGIKQNKVGFIIYKSNTDNGKTAYGYLKYYEQSKATGKLVFDDNSEFVLGGSYGQNEARENATIFYTSNSDGIDGFFEISELPPGIYYIGEVYNKNSGYENSTLISYTVKVDNGAESDKYDDIISTEENLSAYKSEMPYTQTISIDLEGGHTTILKLIDSKDPSDYNPHNSNALNIQGTVFIDNIKDKNNNLGIYDIGEKVLRKAKVSLKRKDGIAYKSNIETNDSGEYTISTSLSQSKISNYYVEVDCTDAEIKNEKGEWVKFDNDKYSLTKSNFTNKKGSKFISYTSNKANTYMDTDTTGEENYGLTKCKSLSYNDSTKTINEVNLGLTPISTTQKVTQIIKEVNIIANGKEYRYLYDDDDKKYVNDNVPTVNWGSLSSYSYTRNIYPSDIRAYADSNELSVKITYAIRIENLTKNSESDQTPYVFDWNDKVAEKESEEKEGSGEHNEGQVTVSIDKKWTREDSMQISTLTESFDSSLYTINDENWTKDDQPAGTVKYKKSIEDLKAKGEGKDKTIVYITFKVNNNKIKELLGNVQGITETQRTTANIDGTHSWSNHFTWTRTEVVSYQETEGEGEEAHSVTKYKDVTTTGTENQSPSNKVNYFGNAEAPNFVYKLPDDGKERTISGTVFEDTDANNSDNELLGNGKYDTENSVKNVKVTLYNTNDHKNPAILYHKGYQTSEDSTTYTNSNGEYLFAGVAAGDYYVVYTYGDGTQYIKGNPVYSSQYKSTIIASGNPMKNGGNWYIDSSDWSFAIDNIEEREYDENDNTYRYSSLYKGVANDPSNTYINAKSDEFSVGVEFTKNTDDLNWNNSRPLFNQMNFGIIKMPVISLKIYKTISNISITLSNGQVITQGDPSVETPNIPYVSTLDINDNYKFGRGGYVKAELDTQYLYGSTLQLTYEIKILNTSDLNYKTKEYYIYGTHGNVESEYTVKVNEILDYLDPKLTYLYSEESGVIVEWIENLKQEKVSSEIEKSREDANNVAERDFNDVLSLVLENCELNTVYGGKSENSNKSVVKVTASKVLSTDDDDLEFKNTAEIVDITTDKEGVGNLCRFMAPTDKERSDYKYKDSGHTILRSDTLDVATITVTPPTGIKDNIVIIISIGIGLIIVISGIVIIKKKVL